MVETGNEQKKIFKKFLCSFFFGIAAMSQSFKINYLYLTM